VILAVAHEKFRDFNITSLVKVNHVIFDVKGAVDPNFIDGRL
jgi:UDP-N-acetyl-D-galactosamine dehydrogenase